MKSSSEYFKIMVFLVAYFSNLLLVINHIFFLDSNQSLFNYYHKFKMAEKFCLKWHDYQQNIFDTFVKLRTDESFCDVTLVADDKKKFEAHKVVISSCSQYFKSILQVNMHPRPILCLVGVKSVVLNQILDYIYLGEVQLHEDHLDDFLSIAQKLQLTGLLATQAKTESMRSSCMKIDKSKSSKLVSDADKIKDETEKDDPKSITPSDANTTNESNDHGGSQITIDEVDKKVEEFLGKNEKGEFCCKLCGKTGRRYKRNMMNHIETHLTGLSFPCNLKNCDRKFPTRSGLTFHKYSFHRKLGNL